MSIYDAEYVRLILSSHFLKLCVELQVFLFLNVQELFYIFYQSGLELAQ